MEESILSDLVVKVFLQNGNSKKEATGTVVTKSSTQTIIQAQSPKERKARTVYY
jgi:hypothetical protein